MDRRIALILLLLMFIIPVSGCLSRQGAADEDMVCISGQCFTVEVVDTAGTRALGLMHRDSLDQDRGMLFIFDYAGTYPFWMKNTLIPLDIIWIGSDMRIVAISKNTPPCEADPCPLYEPGVKSLYALEINAGLSDMHGFDVGDSVEIILAESGPDSI